MAQWSACCICNQKSRVQILLPVTRWICVWWSQIQSSTLCKYSQLVGQVSALPLIRKKKIESCSITRPRILGIRGYLVYFFHLIPMQTQMLSEKGKKKKQSSNLVVSGLLFPHSAWLNRALKYGAIDGSVTRTNRLFNTVLYISAQYSTVQFSSPVDLILVKEGATTPRPYLFMLNHIGAINKQKNPKTNKEKNWRNNVSGQKREKEKKKGTNRKSYVLTVITAGRVESIAIRGTPLLSCHATNHKNTETEDDIEIRCVSLISFQISQALLHVFEERPSEVQTCCNRASVQ